MGKAGKSMNPTDQARKEARRRELKKNKKQRQQVREAVIKQKDPKQIIGDMDLLDKMEFDTNNPPPYSAKVIQEKRGKLRASLRKLYHFYAKEDPKMATEIRHMEIDYDNRYRAQLQHYESVMQAQSVKLDEIPLPDYAPGDGGDFLSSIELPPPPPPTNDVSSIPLPSMTTSTATIEAKSSVIDSNLASLLKKLPRAPPGPPSSSPPDLSDFECDDDEFELGLRAQDPYKPGETVGKKIRFDTAPPKPIISDQPKPTSTTIGVTAATIQASLASRTAAQAAAAAAAKAAYPNIPSMMSAPGSAANQQYPRPVQQYTRPQAQVVAPVATTTSISAPAGVSTIEAKPVLRNKAAEVTKFVPTSIVVRRDPSKKQPEPAHSSLPTYSQVASNVYQQHHQISHQQSSTGNAGTSAPTKSTDADYEKFMAEIENLL